MLKRLLNLWRLSAFITVTETGDLIVRPSRDLRMNGRFVMTNCSDDFDPETYKTPAEVIEAEEKRARGGCGGCGKALPPAAKELKLPIQISEELAEVLLPVGTTSPIQNNPKSLS